MRFVSSVLINFPQQRTKLLKHRLIPDIEGFQEIWAMGLDPWLPI
jgi:hypothetical protein